LDTLWGKRKFFSHPHFYEEPQISTTPSYNEPAFVPTYLYLPTFGFHAFRQGVVTSGHLVGAVTGYDYKENNESEPWGGKNRAVR